MGKKAAVKSSAESTTLSKPRRISHKGARAKGLAFEREIANRLGHIFPEAERQLESQASSCNGIDLQGTDIIKIQCKNHAGYCSVSTINEIRIKDPNHIPVLVTKGIRQEAMAVLPFEKFVTLLEIAYGLSRRFVHPDLKVEMEKQHVLAISEATKNELRRLEGEHIDSVYGRGPGSFCLPDTTDRSALLEDIDCPKQCNALDSLI